MTHSAMYAPWRRRRLRSALLAGLEGLIYSLSGSSASSLCSVETHAQPYIVGVTSSQVVLGCNDCGLQTRVPASSYVASLLRSPTDY